MIVKVKDTKSAGCTSLTQLQRKLLQYIGDMLLDTNILLQKIKQEPL